MVRRAPPTGPRAARAPQAEPPILQPLPRLPPPDERLAIVEPGPDVLFTPAAAASVAEWVAGWRAGPELEASGIPRPGPLFLHGPPGSGKTATTRMIARLLADVRMVVVIDALRVLESLMGATSANIAKASAAAVKANAVLVLEEIDALASIRQYGPASDVENTRSTTSIMRVIELPVPILLTSNRLDVIDPAVIRRCEYIVEMPDPTPVQRREIVERELGDDPGPVTLSLSVAIPLARRARRTAFLNKVSAFGVFTNLCGAYAPALAEHAPHFRFADGSFTFADDGSLEVAGCRCGWKPTGQDAESEIAAHIASVS